MPVDVRSGAIGSDWVGDRVRSLQEFGNVSLDSLLGWRLLLPQVLVQDFGNWAEDPDDWIAQVNFEGDQLRLTLSIEWRSGSAQELDPLLLEVWCEAWAEVVIESGVTRLMVERDTVMQAAQTIDRIEAGR